MIFSKIIRYGDLLKTLKLHFAIAKKPVTGEPLNSDNFACITVRYKVA